MLIQGVRRALFSLLCVGLFSGALQAEYRLWKAANGGFSAEAEFVGLKDANTVTLKMKAGGFLKDIPLGVLSTSDQQFIRTATGGGASVADAAPVAKAPTKGAAAALEKEALTTDTAKEAAGLYRIFLAEPGISSDDRIAATARQPYWEDLAAKNFVRLGTKWVPFEDAQKLRKQAAKLIQQSAELLRLNQDQMAHAKLKEASAIDPGGISADFIIGVVYALALRNYSKSSEHFEIALRRDPGNVALLNNLALTEIRTGEPRGAIMHWRKALSISTDQAVVHNIGRLIDQAGRGSVRNVPKSSIAELTAVYSDLLASGKVKGADKARGWQYMLVPIKSPEELEAQEETANSAPPEPGPDDQKLPGVIAGSGTGFVVAKNYILTNRHVAAEGIAFQIQDPVDRNKFHVATRKAVSTEADLAILHCPTLEAPPLSIEPKLPGRGTDVMLFGFPVSDMLGSSLKATRGALVSPPDPKINGMMLYDATSNPGNSGGPLCNAQGAVIGIHCAGMRFSSNYAAGLPIDTAMAFMKANIPDFEAQAPGTAVLPWPEVDQKVSPSTVLILIRMRTYNLGLAQRVGKDFLEDRWCNTCNGFGKVKCPVNNCGQGTVPSIQVRNLGDRVESVPIRVPCNNCGGDGAVTCRACGGGKLDSTIGR
ncbi:MAG: trypsin-like peptidase domain-containing protein [Planctomycetes bacterium]|nr:trypsin-like peptidase domain-containing protein [Planctomycetota bacterium]